MANLVLKIATGLSNQNMRDALSFSSNKHQPRRFLEALAKSLQDSDRAEIQLLNGNAVQATGTFTFSGAATANDTVLINGVTFTAKATGAGANEFNVGLTATASATNLAAAINGSVSALISGYLQSSSAAGVVTIKAVNAGVSGNFMTIAVGVDGGSVNLASGARLTGGLEDTALSIASKSW